MRAPIHLVTVVGGPDVSMLPPMLRHYQALGIRSFFVVVHVGEPDEAFVAHVSALAASCGVTIDSVEIGRHFPACKERAFERIMEARPDDWFLPVDCDELQVYPDGLAATIEYCERNAYDYVRGCLIDRLSAGGTLTPLDPDVSVWTQYPLGGLLTYTVVGGDPRKVVLSKGHVIFRSCGHHDALTGVGCPGRELFVPVHHFKWVSTLLPSLQRRRDLFRRLNNKYWVESDRALGYFAKHGRIDIADRELMIAPCRPEFELWETARALAIADEERRERFPELETWERERAEP